MILLEAILFAISSITEEFGGIRHTIRLESTEFPQ